MNTASGVTAIHNVEDVRELYGLTMSFYRTRPWTGLALKLFQHEPGRFSISDFTLGSVVGEHNASYIA